MARTHENRNTLKKNFVTKPGRNHGIDTCAITLGLFHHPMTPRQHQRSSAGAQNLFQHFHLGNIEKDMVPYHLEFHAHAKSRTI